MSVTARLREQGWKVAAKRPMMVTDPIDPSRKIQVGEAPSSFVRIHALLGVKEPWFHAKIDQKGKSDSWECVISWRAPGRDCLLASFIEKSPAAAAARAELKLVGFESAARLGWEP